MPECMSRPPAPAPWAGRFINPRLSLSLSARSQYMMVRNSAARPRSESCDSTPPPAGTFVETLSGLCLQVNQETKSHQCYPSKRTDLVSVGQASVSLWAVSSGQAAVSCGQTSVGASVSSGQTSSLILTQIPDTRSQNCPQETQTHVRSHSHGQCHGYMDEEPPAVRSDTDDDDVVVCPPVVSETKSPTPEPAYMIRLTSGEHVANVRGWHAKTQSSLVRHLVADVGAAPLYSVALPFACSERVFRIVAQRLDTAYSPGGDSRRHCQDVLACRELLLAELLDLARAASFLDMRDIGSAAYFVLAGRAAAVVRAAPTTISRGASLCLAIPQTS